MEYEWKKAEDHAAILGKTPAKITHSDDEIIMHFSDGSAARWYHEQCCCESVVIEDITGDLQDLIGHPLLTAECRTNSEESDDYDSNTWTFYTFRNIGGTVDVRWHGSSNGFYSESVDFEIGKPVDWRKRHDEVKARLDREIKAHNAAKDAFKLVKDDLRRMESAFDGVMKSWHEQQLEIEILRAQAITDETFRLAMKMSASK